MILRVRVWPPQARRRGAQRLVFFNANLGTWEQFEAVDGIPPNPWSETRLTLRNRRLPQVRSLRAL